MTNNSISYKTGVFGLLLFALSACQSGEQKTADAPNAVRDLLIDRIFWKAGPADQTSKVSVNLHRFTITNTSPKYSYSQIEVQFDYYDRDHHKIDSAKQTVKRTLDPRAAITIGELPTGPAKPETTSATVTVLTAVGELAP